MAEHANGVRNCFKTSQRSSTVGEGLEQIEDAEAHQESVGRGPRVIAKCCISWLLQDMKRSVEFLHESNDNDRTQRQDEEVDRHGKPRAGFFNASQVSEQQQADHPKSDGHSPVNKRGEGRIEGHGSSRSLHGNGHGVVNEQRHGGHLSEFRTEVISSHHVGSADRRVVAEDLQVRQRHEEQHRNDGQGDRDDHGECTEANDRQHHNQHFFGAIGRGRNHVRSEDAEGNGVGERLMGELLGDERGSEDLVLQAIGPRFWICSGVTLSASSNGCFICVRRRLRCHSPPSIALSTVGLLGDVDHRESPWVESEHAHCHCWLRTSWLRPCP